MDITVSQAKGKVPITVLKLAGELDGQTYQSLIAKANELYDSGTRYFLVDMEGLSYISSAGLVALHTVSLLAGSGTLPSTESDWSAIRSTGSVVGGENQNRVKLLNPRKEVESLLDMVGFSNVFEIYSDFDQAVNSF